MLEATQTASGEIVFEQSQRWEGQIVNGTYPLRQYISGSEHSAVFLTEILTENLQKAAIKLIAANETNADIQLGRLRLSAKLSHPHLLQIFEVGSCQIDGHHVLFVVMEYADENLAQILPQRSLTPQETRDLLTPTLETLAYIHNNGFAHGRVKPANILVAGERIKLSSDGLCRPGAVASKQLSAYDPPEAATEGLTPAGDAWSLGITLAEALTQRLPTWTDRLGCEPSLPDSMPKPFAEIAAHCLIRDPRSRWKIAEMIDRLSIPSLARKGQRKPNPPGASTKPQNPSNYWLYAIPIAAMVGIILLLAGLLHRGPNEKSRANEKSKAKASAVLSTPAAPTSAARSEAGTGSQGTLGSDQVIRQVVPDVPAKALRTISGRLKVTVRAHIDERGNVARAEFASAGPSRYFANLAMQSAQEWKFTPLQSPKTWLLQFTFMRSGVKVQPRQVG